ncbi:MAG: excisionase family DNA-binding protein [Rubrobacter sp.]
MRLVTDVRERDPVPVPDRDASTVRELDKVLAGAQGKAVLRSPSGHELPLPHSVYRVLEQVVHEMARGNAVRVLPVKAELSTQQAADLLNVSRPHLVKLLERGEIPYHRAGSHRRVVLEDLLVYKERRDRESLEALDEVTRISEELGLYDE